jgi:large subunit ribosomal protein L35
MAKLKTNKSMKKRFSVTGNGQLKHKKPGTRHLNAKKLVAQKRRKNAKKLLLASSKKFIIKNLPGFSTKVK